MDRQASEFQLRAITSRIGAEIDGLDLRRPLSDGAREAVRRAVAERGLVVFRKQDLTSEQYLAFARRFGEVEAQTSAFLPAVDETKAVAEVRKDPSMVRTIGGSWHTDQIERSRPTWGVMLLCRKAPATGGDTCFASTAAAYESLSKGLKKTIETLRAVHWDGALQERFQTGRPPKWRTSHPLAPEHPQTGRRFLYVSPGYTLNIDGWTVEESRGLLQHLYSVIQDPAFGCRIRWEEGTLVFWDTYQTWHYAIDDYGYGERVMHRIAVIGPHFE